MKQGAGGETGNQQERKRKGNGSCEREEKKIPCRTTYIHRQHSRDSRGEAKPNQSGQTEGEGGDGLFYFFLTFSIPSWVVNHVG